MARTSKAPNPKVNTAKAPASKKEKAVFVATTLAKLYPRTSIPLDHEDPYTLLVAVALNFILRRVLGFITRQLPGEVEDILLAIVRGPLVILVLVYGLARY